MRLNSNGDVVPSTLGEYRDLCALLGGEDCKAVKLLDEQITKDGRDEKVVADDSQMCALLIPMLVEKG